MADIGTTLREARMRARIDITEVERATKIRARYLRAMEHEEWDALPGPVYVKSFLRTYSDYLGLDSRMLVDEYKRRFERPSDHEVRPSAASRRRERERERRPRGPLMPPWMLIGLVLVAVVVALFIVGTLGGGKNKPTVHASTTATTTTQTVRHHTVHHRATPRAPTTVTLRLVPTSRVYVCLEDATGKPLIPGEIFSPGQTIPTESSTKLLLTLGNAGVHMIVNGKSVPVKASATAIGYQLTPTGTTPLAPAQEPTCQ